MDNNNFDANKAFLENDTSDIVYTNDTSYVTNDAVNYDYGSTYTGEEFSTFSSDNFAGNPGDAYASDVTTDYAQNYASDYVMDSNYGYTEPNPGYTTYGQPDLSVFQDNTDYGVDTYSFDENKYVRNGRILSFVSLGFLIAAVLSFLSRFVASIVIALFSEFDPSLTESLAYVNIGVNGFLNVMTIIFWLVSLIVMIVLRVKHKDSTFGLVLMIIHIIIASLAALYLIFLLVMGVIVIGSCLACLSMI